jgi:hypothetical protein
MFVYHETTKTAWMRYEKSDEDLDYALFTVGFYTPAHGAGFPRWNPIADFTSDAFAQVFIHYLNGGGDKYPSTDASIAREVEDELKALFPIRRNNDN